MTAADDTDIFNSNTQQYVRISAISPSVIGGGFGTVALTLTFSTPVPANLQYRVYYGRRVTVANLPVEMASNPMIRRTPNRVCFPEFDRTGYAPTSISPDQDYTTTYPDPYLSQWKATLRGVVGVSNTYDANYSGAIGYIHIGSRKNKLDINDRSVRGVPGAACLYAYEKDIRTSTFVDASVPLTRIDSSLAASVYNNHLVTLNAANYFYSGAGPFYTAIRLGVDMLEVTFANGSKKVVVVTAFGANPQEAVVTTLGGANPTFGVPVSAVTVKWIRPTFYTGGAVEQGGFEFKGSAHLSPSAISNTPATELTQSSFFFAAGTPNPVRDGGGWNHEAMTWGSYQDTGSSPSAIGLKLKNGALLGDGTVESYGGRVRGLISKRSTNFYSISSSTPFVWDPYSTSVLGILFVNSSAKVLTLTLDPDYVPQDGDSLEVIVCNSDTSGLGWQSTIVWPTSFKFSGADADVSGILDEPTFFVKFVGTYMNGACYFTRTDYEA